MALSPGLFKLKDPVNLEWRWPVTTSDKIYLSYHSVVALSGIALNTFVLVSIIFSPPAFLRNLKPILILMTIVNLCESITSLATIVRSIEMSSSVAYVFLGPCNMFPAKVCHSMLSFQMHNSVLQCSLILLAFISRFNLQRRREMTNVCLRCVCFTLGWIPALTTMTLFIVNFDNSSIIPHLHEDYLFIYRLVGQVNMYDPFVMPHYVILTVYPIITLAACLIIFFWIRKRMEKDKHSHSFQKPVIIMLGFQLVHPIAMVFGNTLFFIAKFSIVHSIFIESTNSGMLATVAAIISPIIFIAYLKSFFKRTVRRLVNFVFCKHGSAKIHPSTSISIIS